MEDSEIERKSLRRIATVFAIPADEVQRDWRFGHELKASFRSELRRNEVDLIDDDIHDVADKETLRAFSAGTLMIATVGDYCDLMIRSSRKDMRLVAEVLAQ